MENVVHASPCNDCKEREKFDFFGCTKNCKAFFEHLKKVFEKECSPCMDFRCAIPRVNEKNREKCRKCPLPGIYSERVGIGPKSKLGRRIETDSYLYPYEGKYPWEGKRR